MAAPETKSQASRAKRTSLSPQRTVRLPASSGREPGPQEAQPYLDQSTIPSGAKDCDGESEHAVPDERYI